MVLDFNLKKSGKHTFVSFLALQQKERTFNDILACSFLETVLTHSRVLKRNVTHGGQDLLALHKDY